MDRKTIQKIAAAADVDPRTVARVIAGKHTTSATRAVILAAAKRLKVDLEPAPSAPDAPREAA